MDKLFQLLGWFQQKKDAQTPVTLVDRIKNIAVNNFRGILGSIIPIILMIALLEREKPHMTTIWIWLWMFWSFLIQPVNIPVTGLIPVFAFPLFMAMSTENVCNSYVNENILLFILAGWLLLLLNNSGFDRRLTLKLLCGSSNRCSSAGLLIRSSAAAFILSMVSNRLIVTANLIQYVAPTLINLQSSTKRDADSDFDKLRCVIINAIHTSSAIGGIVVPHASFGTLAFRAVFYASAPENMLDPGKTLAFPDVFSYVHYTAFAFPTAIVMFGFNLIYNIVRLGRQRMSESSQIVLKSALDKHRDALPKKITLHEVLTIVSAFLSLVMYYSRWSSWFEGWGAGYTKGVDPGVKDATVSAIFIVLLSIIPCSFGFTKYCSAKKKSQLPPLKPESAIMWWKFVDKNTIYGYIFLIGSGVCLTRGIAHTKLNIHLQNHMGTIFTNQDHYVMMFMIVFVIVVLVNIMSGVAALCVFLPFVIHMIKDTSPHFFRKHYGPLGVGIGTSLGFMCPFLYTPAYFAHHVGKVPKRKMAMAGLPSAIICAIILWLALCVYADIVMEGFEATILGNVTDSTLPTEVTVTTEAPGGIFG